MVPRCVASPGVASPQILEGRAIAPVDSITAKKVAIVSLGCPKNTVDGTAPALTVYNMWIGKADETGQPYGRTDPTSYSYQCNGYCKHV
jgi:hypothetical protein